MIKVNQINSSIESEKFSLVDIATFVVGDVAEDRVVDVETCLRLKDQMSSKISVYPHGSLKDPERLREVVDLLSPDFIEFSVIDPEKTMASEAQIESLEKLEIDKIANGLFIMKDEMTLLDRTSHLDALVGAGVKYFQVELESLVDPNFRISAAGRRKISEFCSKYPVIVGDNLGSVSGYPRLGQCGYYLNLCSSNGRSYDYSQRSYSLPAAMKVVRQCAGSWNTQ